MANTQRSQWMGDWMRSRAVRGAGAFRANQRLMQQASVAYADAHGGTAGRQRHNPRANAAVRSNPSGGDLMKLGAIVVGLYVLVPQFRQGADSLIGGLRSAATPAPTAGTL